MDSNPAPEPPRTAGAERELVVLGTILAIHLGLVYRGILSATPSYPSSISLHLFPSGWLLAAALGMMAWRPRLRVNISGGRGMPFWIGLSALAWLGTLLFGIWAMKARNTAWPVPFWSVVLLAPISEEVFFRGVLLVHFRRNLNTLAAILLSSLLFGIQHCMLGHMWLMAALGLVLGLAAVISRSVLWPILLHMQWNLLAQVHTMPPDWPLWPPMTAAGLAIMLAACWGWRWCERSVT